MEEIRRASTILRTGDTTIDNPKCTCCNPAVYLEPPADGEANWTCPMTGKKYSYDPGEGVVREVGGPNVSVNQTVNPRREAVDDDLIPHSPNRGERRQVDPNQDKFA